MKTVFATLAIALTTAAPVFAETAAQRFALDNDSAAERILGAPSLGNIDAAQDHFAAGNDSAAETLVRKGASNVTRASAFDTFAHERSEEARARLALDNDSAAERIIFRK